MHHARVRSLRRRLDALVETRDARAALESDPLGIVHRYKGDADREVVGLVAASLAFGNVVAIRRSIDRVLRVLGGEPARRIASRSEGELRRDLDGFVHRIYRGEHMARLLANAGKIRAREGSLGVFVAKEMKATHGDLRESLARLSDQLRGDGADRGLRHLVSDPRAGSACKRLLLYARWMIRPDDGVDLGLWDISPASLLIPVDTHIHRIAQNLELTARSDASWRTAEEITTQLRRLDAEDPVKYDFALCHLGVSRDCPSQRDAAKCGGCALRSACSQWR